MEGPLWIENSLEQSGYLLFSDIPNNQIIKYSPTEGVSTYLTDSGFSNGLNLTPQNQLVIMQSRSRQVAVMEAPLNNAKTNYKALATHYHGKRLNSPNDVAVDNKGNVFFTDPPYGLPKSMDDPAKELDFQGVFKLSPEGDLKLLDKSLTFPNGIALSPDNRTLYVAVSDPDAPAWYQYQLDEQGEVLSKKLFYQVAGNGTHDNGAPDGLKVHSSGVVFATGPYGVWLFSPTGEVLAKINIPYFCANLAFDDKEQYLYITANDRLLRIKLAGDHMIDKM
ncbi:SMP-30/gluconolactonase/LRE family protein [Catenovulum sp. 2E275]|nr:SMP-30/gluconolactonase/LRE family protein [Catenovulum sp. 2E275]MCU4675624.1 SMP-30/gluconolactonase/LRE family protein [Catenovulum sp. 2E275]